MLRSADANIACERYCCRTRFLPKRLMRYRILLMLSLLQQPHEADSLLADIIGLNAIA